MKRVHRIGIAILLTVGLVTVGSSIAPYSGLGADKRGGTISLVSGSHFGRLDPVATQLTYIQVIAYNLFGQLVRYKDGTWEVIPDLAKGWNISNGGHVYTLHMRRGLKFHDASPIKLSDVVFSLDRAFHSPMSVWKAGFKGVKSITADSSKDSIMITLSAPDPFLLSKMAAIGGSAIVPEAVVKKYGDQFATTVESTIGSGPFRLVEETPTRLVLERFSDFYAPAYVDRVVVPIIPDFRTQQLEFNAGKVNALVYIPDLNVAKQLQRDPKFVHSYKEFLAPAVNWLGFNIASKPFDDVRVRQALVMAIDRKAMGKVDGSARPSDTLLHRVMVGYEPSPPAYAKDVARAKALLQAAGYGSGLKTDFFIYSNPVYLAQVEVMQQQLAEIGVQIRIREADFATHMSAVREKKLPFFFTLANILYPDPAVFMYNNFDSKGPFNGGYENKEVDRLLEQAIGTANVKRRARLAAEADQIVRKDAAVIYIWNRIGAYVFQPWIHGVENVTLIYPQMRLNGVWIDPSHR